MTRASLGADARPANAARWRLGVLLAVAGLGVLRIVLQNTLTQDDAFFLDVAYHLTDAHRLALGIWGNVFHHEQLLASYPPLAPAIVVLDVWAMRALHSVWFLKSTGVLLQVASAALLWSALGVVRAPGWRAAIVLAAVVEPVSMVFFFTLRPEALLMPLMLVLFVSLRGVIDGRPGARTALVCATVAGILTHWQLPATVALIALAVGAAAIGDRSLRRFAAAYVAVAAAVYGAYGLWLVGSSDRWQAFHDQVLAAAGSSSGAAKIKFLAANVLAGNLAAGSGFSVVLVLGLALLCARGVRAHLKGSRDARRRVLVDLGFVAAALVPTLALDYVGPRAIPLYFVAVVVVVESTCGPDRLPSAWIGLTAVAAALSNAIGNALIQRLYVHRAELGAMVGMPVVWLGAALAAWIVARRGSAARAAATALCGVAIVGAAGLVSIARDSDLPAHDDVVRDVEAQIAGPALAGASVLCDVRDFYLPLRAAGAPARIYSTFPILHYGPPDFDRILADMRPTVLLSSDALDAELQTGSPAARRFLAWRDARFVLEKRFTVKGHAMAMYVSRPAAIDRQP